MKALLTILAITLSVNAMANHRHHRHPSHPRHPGHPAPRSDVYVSYTAGDALAGITATGYSLTLSLITEDAARKTAETLTNDSQEYFQTGLMSPILEKEVAQIVAQNDQLSTEDAVSIVLDYAATYL